MTGVLPKRPPLFMLCVICDKPPALGNCDCHIHTMTYPDTATRDERLLVEAKQWMVLGWELRDEHKEILRKELK